MERVFLEQARAERLIAIGRLVLSVFAAAAVLIDPDVAAAESPQVVVLAGFFGAYAVVLLLLSWHASRFAARARIPVHIVDILLFSTFIQLTHASVSPFFVFFLFSLLSALTRFGVRGMLITAAAVLTTYVTMALIDPGIRSDPAYLIMRSTSLAVATLLLTYVGAYYERIREELVKLAGWPRAATEQREPLVRETLDLARDLLRVPRAVLMWEDEDEPWLYVGERGPEGFSLRNEAPGLLERIMGGEARRASVLPRQRTAAAARVFGDGGVLSAVVAGQSVTGRIFFLGREDFQFDDVAVAEIAGRLVANRLDQVHIAMRTRDAAVSEERLRVARDLHDGLLQSLTGAALQLEIAHQLVDRDSEGARERLRNVQNLVAANQRELRALINDLRPTASRPRASALSPRLQELAERFQRQWGVRVSVHTELPMTEIPDALAFEIYGIVNEAVANAAKHAQATAIAVDLRVNGGDDVAITVTDNGHGFPFHGTYTLAQLNEAKLGPVTLKERVASLGGELVLHSEPTGVKIEVRVTG